MSRINIRAQLGETWPTREQELFYPCKRASHTADNATRQERQRNLLLAFDDVMRALNVRFFLMYGTLLGILRDGDIIPWDRDVDVAVVPPDTNRIPDLINDCRLGSLEICRALPFFFSVTNPEHNVYLDVYMFGYGSDKKGFHRSGFYSYLNQNRDMFDMPTRHMDNPEYILWKGRTWCVPRDPLFWIEVWYGSTWKEPIVFSSEEENHE